MTMLRYEYPLSFLHSILFPFRLIVKLASGASDIRFLVSCVYSLFCFM